MYVQAQRQDFGSEKGRSLGYPPFGAATAKLSRPLVPEPNLIPWQNLFSSF